VVSKSDFSKFKYQAKRRGRTVDLTFDQYRQLKISDCYYCKTPYYLFASYCKKQGYKTPYMSLDRKNNLLNYTADNVAASCFICNRIKGNFFSADEMMEIGVKFVKPKFQMVEQEVFEDYLEDLEHENP